MLARTTHISKSAVGRSIQCQSHGYLIRLNSSSAYNVAATLLRDSTSRATPRDTNDIQTKRGTDRQRYTAKHPAVRTVYVRFWEPVTTVADVWAAKRALAKKYGAILEISFLKDFEMPNKYQLIAFVIFRDTESLNRISMDGEDFTFYAPEAPKNPHEISISDLESLASNEDYQAEFQFDKPEQDTKRRVIGGRIRRSDTEFCEHPSYRSRFQNTSKKHMEFFFNWGGFSDAPMDISRKVTESELFLPNAREEHARMRAALQLCTENTSLGIPRQIAGMEELVTKRGSAGPSLRSARVFAGLYTGDSKPALGLGRPKRDTIEEREKIAAQIKDEIPLASSFSTTVDVDIQNVPSQVTDDKSAKLEDSTPKSPPSTDPPGPIRRPAMSGEEKAKLESQLNAVRLLQRATTPVRRKQPKPSISEVPKKPKARPRREVQGSPVEEEPQEKGGFLSNIMSLFGR